MRICAHHSNASCISHILSATRDIKASAVEPWSARGLLSNLPDPHCSFCHQTLPLVNLRGCPVLDRSDPFGEEVAGLRERVPLGLELFTLVLRVIARENQRLVAKACLVRVGLYLAPELRPVAH